MSPIHATFTIVAHGIHLGSWLKKGMPCLRTLVTMTIWVNYPHIIGRLGVALLFEFLIITTMPFAATMLGYPR